MLERLGAIALLSLAVTIAAGCGEKDEPRPRGGVLAHTSRWIAGDHGLKLRLGGANGRTSLQVRGDRGRVPERVTLTDTARSFRRTFTGAAGARTLRAAVPPEHSPCGGDLLARIRLRGSRRVLTERIPAVAAERPQLAPKPRWPKPRLRDPEHVRITAAEREPRLDPEKDYVVHLPDTPLRIPEGVVITGGHDVVLEGGEIDVQRRPGGGVGRALFLQKQTGTVHVEGLLIRGAGLGDAINLDERRGATVQLQNLRVEYTHARDQRHFTDTHPDVVQSWAGPRRLRIDRLSACTGYQGLFLHPTQFDERARLQRAELSRVNITGTLESAYLLWQATRFPVSLRDVWIRPNPRKGNALWPSPVRWKGVHLGTPPRGDFMPAGAAGVNYRR